MIKNTVALIFNDLAIALKNRSFYLILFIPLFAVLSLKLVDPSNEALRAMKIGVIRNTNYPSVIIKSLRSSDKVFTVFVVGNEEEGKQKLKEKTLDGLLIKAQNGAKNPEVLVLNKESAQTLAIISGFTVLQRAAEGKSAAWLSDIKALHDGGRQKQALPIWVLMSVLLVGLIIIYPFLNSSWKRCSKGRCRSPRARPMSSCAANRGPVKS